MEFTQIPNIKQRVSRIGLGTWAIGGWLWGGTEEKASIETILQALDQGINLIDTAPVYGFGIAEEIVGKALKEFGKRDEVVVVTKVGLAWKDEQTVFRDSRREDIVREIDASLKRMKLDHIDLYLVHWPDTLTPFEETARALNDVMKAGKIRAIGVSNFSLEQMEAFQKGGPLHALEPPFNLFERDVEKKELAFCLKQKIATLGYGSLCRGLLSGKMSKERHFSGDDLRKGDPKFNEPHLSQYLQATKLLQEWAASKYKKSLLALAIRWALDKGISVALWGARKPAQLAGIDEVWGWKLTESDMREIDAILARTVTNPGGALGQPPLRKK